MLKFFKTRKALQNEIETLRKDARYWQDKYEQQAMLLGAARTEATDLRKQNEALHATIDRLNSDNEQLHQDIETLDQDARDRGSELWNLRDENTQLKRSNEELQKQLDEAKTKQPRNKKGQFKPKWNK